MNERQYPRKMQESSCCFTFTTIQWFLLRSGHSNQHWNDGALSHLMSPPATWLFHSAFGSHFIFFILYFKYQRGLPWPSNLLAAPVSITRLIPSLPGLAQHLLVYVSCLRNCPPAPLCHWRICFMRVGLHITAPSSVWSLGHRLSIDIFAEITMNE